MSATPLPNQGPRSPYRLAIGWVALLAPLAAGLSCSKDNPGGPDQHNVPPATIALSSTSVTFTAAAGGNSPAAQTVTVSNSGGGSLSGLGIGTITYGAGASGWLAASVSPTTAPATVTLTPTLGSLAAGTYTATVPVNSSAGSVTNSPQTISVTFTVTSTNPAIGLNPTSVAFTAVAGGSSPAAKTVAVSNSGGGTLSGLSVGTITYGAGASGWLAASVSPATAPATVTLTPTLGALGAGGYTATVPVTSSAGGVTNSPQTISVTFTVSSTPPAIALNPTSLTFTATAGGSSPVAQTVAVSNSGGGTLSGLSVGIITYGAGASGWLAASVSPTTAPATVTVTPTLGGLGAGGYTATVPVTSSAGGVTNSPQTINVTFTVNPVVAPVAPSGLSATVSPTMINFVRLQWSDNSSNESGFFVEWSTTGGSLVARDTVAANGQYRERYLPGPRRYNVRVGASNAGGTSWSSSIQVAVPGKLRIINDLPSGTDGYGNNWTQLNTMVTIRAGQTQASVTNSCGPCVDLLDNDYTRSLPGAALLTGHQDDFTIPFYDATDYYILVWAGWWEYDGFNYYWLKHYSATVNCAGTVVSGNKWAIVHIYQPFLETEQIRLSDYLPQMSWYGTPFCS